MARYENYTAMKLAITDMVEEISGVIRGHIKKITRHLFCWV